ncbi:MAG: succinate dehydrogenase cytochrome b subunit [Flavobacteriales bacterium]|nr:succinate dehydrogenase cytochrome b subunit [Flavobacteriales bacterium]
MSNTKWLSTSIGRKFFMALTGLFLITFITLHLAINLLTMVSKDAFNEASHFMATNPLIQVMQYVLAAGFLIHIVMGINLTLKNKSARPEKYAYNRPSANSGFSSRSMIITGMLVLVFLVLHLRDYFVELKFGDMNGFDNDYDLVVTLFGMWYYTLIYVLAFIALGIHLNHGFQSAFQSMGANHSRYTPLIKKLGAVYCVIIAAGFSAIAIFHFVNA